MIDLVVLDVGNTTATVALFEGDRIAARDSFSHADSGGLERLLAFVGQAPRTCEAALVGVRAAVAEPLGDRLSRDRPVLVAPRDFRAPIENACSQPETVGMDRLFNAAAAAVRHSLPAVVIDAGTAVTIDRTDPPGVFRGGAIAAGVRLCFAALNRETGQLPLVAPDPCQAPVALGTDTTGAIRSGVVRGIAGLIDRLAGDLAGPDTVAVVLTGGDAKLLLPLLRTTLRYDADLTLHGIARGARRRFRPEAQ